MENLNIVISHGPVETAEFLEDNSILFTLEDKRTYEITFSIIETLEGKFYHRYIIDKVNGLRYHDKCTWDIFDEALTVMDYIQWTADNFNEVLELIGYKNGEGNENETDR